MNYDVKKIRTAKGKDRLELRVWGYGPNNLDFTRRFKDKKTLHLELDGLMRDEDLVATLPTETETKVQTFGELQADFMKRQAHAFSPGWKANLEGYWREFELKLSNLPPEAINSDLLKSIEKDLIVKGNSQRTVNLKTGWIKAVLNFAVEMDKIPMNPATKFKKKKPLEPNIQFWERADAEDFLSFTSSKYPRGSIHRWRYVVYLLGINAGLRAGETWALKPRCLKQARGIMHIDQQYCTRVKDFRPPKGKGPRDVPLNQTLLDELEALIERESIGRHDCIFTSSQGKPVDHNNFSKRIFWNEFSDTATDLTKFRGLNKVRWGGQQIKFHGLRHTAATLMLSSGVNVKSLQDILGHKDLATTMKYVHAIAGNAKLAGEVFTVKPASSKLKVVREISD